MTVLNGAKSTAHDVDPISLVKLIAETGGLVIGLMFIAGWSYLASYYRTFGLNPIELDVPVPVVATIAFHVLYDSVWVLPIIVLIAGGFWGAVRHYVRGRTAYRSWIATALVLLILGAATAALFRGRQKANADMVEESSTLPFVSFSSRSEAAKIGPPEQPSCVAYNTFGAMDCRLLLHSRGLYYFFHAIPKLVVGKTDKLDLFMIVDTDVMQVHVQRGIDLGDGRQ